MIVGKLSEVMHQCASSPSMQKAFDFLRELQDNDFSDGKVEIDGTNVYAIFQSFPSTPVSGALKFEVHRRYIDIQYLVDGKELMGWAHSDKMMTTIPYNADKDALYGVVPLESVTYIRYSAGQAVILYPSDAHSPGLADGISEAIKKVVVKIAVSSL